MKRQVIFGTVFSAALAVGVGAQSPGSTSGSQSASPQGPAASGQQVTVVGCLQGGDMASSTGSSTSAGSAGSATGSTAGAPPAGTAGTTGSSATGSSATADRSGAIAGGQFVLTNAQVSTGSSGATAGSTGATGATTAAGTSGTAAAGSASAAGAGSRFVLVGGNQQNLRQYANSKVEITGMLDHQGTAGAAAAGTGSTAGATTGSTTGATTGSTASPTGAGAGSTMSGSSHGAHAGMSHDGAKLHVTSVRQVASSCADENR